jgi:hypothetical protein
MLLDWGLAQGLATYLLESYVPPDREEFEYLISCGTGLITFGQVVKYSGKALFSDVATSFGSPWRNQLQ